MPVNVRGVEERDDRAMTLRLLAEVGFTEKGFAALEIEKDWDRLKGPFHYAKAEVKPGATVVLWQTSEQDGEPLRDQAGNPKPYIVRQSVGAGSVTWVAQDLGDKQLLGNGANYDEGQRRGNISRRGDGRKSGIKFLTGRTSRPCRRPVHREIIPRRTLTTAGRPGNLGVRIWNTWICPAAARR